MKRLNRQIIGLTGSIGSGKSTASAKLASLGAHVLDADAVSRGLLEPDGACYQEVIQAFGDDIVRIDGSIDRSALGRIVFSDEAKRLRLNGIVHPRVCRSMMEQARMLVSDDPLTPVILDVPLLFECGMEKDMDETVLVYTDDTVRLERILARDHCTIEDARARMDSQMPQEQKRQLADIILDNSGTREELYSQLENWYAGLLSDLSEDRTEAQTASKKTKARKTGA